MKTLSIRIDQTLNSEILERSRKSGKSNSAVARDLLEKATIGAFRDQEMILEILKKLQISMKQVCGTSSETHELLVGFVNSLSEMIEEGSHESF